MGGRAKDVNYYHSKERSGEDTSFTWTLLFTEEEGEKFIHSTKISVHLICSWRRGQSGKQNKVSTHMQLAL